MVMLMLFKILNIRFDMNLSDLLRGLQKSMDITAEEIQVLSQQELIFKDEDMIFEALPEMDEVLAEKALKGESVTISPPLTVNQTTATEKISIRLPHWVLETFKQMAEARGVKYQTYINQILSHCAAGYAPF